MKEEKKEKKNIFSFESPYKAYVIAAVIVAVLGIFSNIMLAINLPQASLKNLLVVLLSVLLYTSLILYCKKYYVDGDKTQGISSMLIRFAGSMVGSLIAARYGSTVIFMSLAVIMLLVPYMAGDVTKEKRCKVIAVVVLLLTIVISVVRISTIREAREYLSDSFLRDWYYYVDECNQMIQWILFCILYFIRAEEE